MSNEYLSHPERFNAAIEDLGDLRDELLVTLTDAATLVEHLAGVDRRLTAAARLRIARQVCLRFR